ncbi:TrkH family potassium uptake protein [Agaribacterium sp. ZY112]|uniref:TrkH family potassium uptake protein n=1 Tax=Agaribacterium sp. ZY112 TaxID=3233574 RepID=UPI0035258270
MRIWARKTYHHRHKNRHHKPLAASPPAILAGGFFLLIIIGTLLLKLPGATNEPLSWLQSLFTATSAVTVTGLSVVDTGSEFTRLGDIIIMVLVQLGGLGFMTFSVVTALALGTRLGLRHKIIAQEALNQTSIADVHKAAKIVVLFSLVIETIGFLILTLAWQQQKGWETASFEALFYTISAFNNAGFGLEPSNLSNYVSNVPINLTICLLFIIGGLGFAILADLWARRNWKDLRPYTKTILIATAVINLLAFIAVLALEANNPATLGQLEPGTKIIAAWFHALSPRTAGFNTVDIGAMKDATSVFMMLLMFIGGGSMSTASGIKIGTFVVLIFATYSFLRQRDEVNINKRRLSNQQVMKALAVAVMSMAVIFVGIFALSISEDANFLDLAFEVVSAAGTVGLSRGLTQNLSPIGQCTIMMVMFAGRVGPLTLIWLLATPKKGHLRYPKSNFQIG